MRIELVTSGGFTGLGVGSIRIDGTTAVVDGGVATELTAAEVARIDRLPILKRLTPRGSTPDSIVFTLVIDGQRWRFGEHGAPPEFANWANALLEIRRRVVDQTPSSR
ncbi:MAG TPA: hypothetical protein VLU46_16295 [Thermoanaerobaculia bacterium]|nr:hypothetical protein [Thermoanaerobaculia bacterium]